MESISRISSLLETARDLTLEAARDAGSRKPNRPVPAQQIKKLLDSRSERDVLDALRKVIVMQYSDPPQPTLQFFPAVLKTLSHPYPSTRPLVYNYLIHHAEADPDTALLAINTIQKSLSDTNPRVRAMALKTMSGIRVPVISQIVSLAIKKGVSDLSPLVRKAAALACVKCVRLDPTTRPQIEEHLAALLADKQYYVAGAAVQAFMEICPSRLDLIHPVYRRICKMVVDMDEWGQIATIRLMTIYARCCFPRRTQKIRKAAAHVNKETNFYDDLEPREESETNFEEIEVVDHDLELFLKSIQSLLQSRNAAVILSVARAYLYLSPTNYLHQCIGPLIALLRSPQDIQQVVLYNIVQICLLRPELFLPYPRHFLIRSSEAPSLWELKLEVLTLVFSHCSPDMQDLILAELEHFSQGRDAYLVSQSVKAIGRCAQNSSSQTSRRCLSLLLKQIHSLDQNLVGEAIEVVRHMIQCNPTEHSQTVIRLAKNLDTLTSPTARASVVWLVGEYASGSGENEGIAADVLRILVRGYADEDDEVKSQIVLLAAKVYLHFLNARNAKQSHLEALDLSGASNNSSRPNYDTGSTGEYSLRLGSNQELRKPHPIESLYQYTMLLAHYTTSYDLRDRVRLYRALLLVPNSTELGSLLLLAPKPIPQAPSPSESRKDLTLGSASLVIGSNGASVSSPSMTDIPDWVIDGREPDPALRDDTEIKAREYAPIQDGAVPAGQKLDEALAADPGYKNGAVKKEKSLDAWLDEDEEANESEETSEDESEGTSGSESEETSGEESEETSEDESEEN